MERPHCSSRARAALACAALALQAGELLAQEQPLPAGEVRHGVDSSGEVPRAGAFTRIALSAGAAGIETGSELDLGRGLSLGASGVRGLGDPGVAGARLGLGFLQSLFSAGPSLAISGGVLRDLAGQNGTWMRLSLGRDFGRLGVGVSLQGEHLFAAGNDALDLTFSAGVSCRVGSSLRLIVEYVGQDMEEALGGRTLFRGGLSYSF